MIQKRINSLFYLVETHHMFSHAQIRAKCKQFMISALNPLIDQVHAVWNCNIKYMMFMLSLDIIEMFDYVLHVRFLHTLKMRRTLSYIIKWTCSFLKDRESSLIFDDQTSTMHWVDINISQSFSISSILFLFFNINFIEKCKALKIKIKVLNFVNDINILIYDKFTEKILNRAHNVCKM